MIPRFAQGGCKYRTASDQATPSALAHREIPARGVRGAITRCALPSADNLGSGRFIPRTSIAETRRCIAHSWESSARTNPLPAGAHARFVQAKHLPRATTQPACDILRLRHDQFRQSVGSNVRFGLPTDCPSDLPIPGAAGDVVPYPQLVIEALAIPLDVLGPLSLDQYSPPVTSVRSINRLPRATSPAAARPSTMRRARRP